MQYDIRLTMHYDYDYPVGGGRHQIRMLPLNLAGVQRVVAASLAVDAGARRALRLHRFLRQPRHLDRRQEAA